MQKTHPFHIVELSPLPILTSFALLLLTSGGVMFMHDYTGGNYVLTAGILSVFICLYKWWSSVIIESKVHHNDTVRLGLRFGMALFILSEIMFFVVFFWSFLKSNIFPAGILDDVWVVAKGVWPPKGIQTFDPFDIPLMNTIILLLSGTTVTWAHYALKDNRMQEFRKALGYTILLGIFFTFMQAYEYHHATFTIKDGIYGSNFYLATGFHGLHVIIGTIFLGICYLRAIRGDFSKGNSHLGFEVAAWYWHFVDIVWIFLFIFVYILGQ